MRRSLPVLLAASIAALALAGCSGSSSPADGTSTSTPSAASTACAPAASGDLSDAVKLTAKPGTEPKTSFTTPVNATTSQRTVATEGDGQVVKEGTTVTLEFSMYDGATGKTITSTGFDGSAPQSIQLGSSLLPGLLSTVECSTVGSRVVGVLAPDDMWGSSGEKDLGVNPGDSIVLVVDVTGVVTPPAVEKYGDMTGMPTVKFASSGEPTITIPKADAPSKTRIGLIKEGTGATVAAGDSVSVQYTGVVWRTGKVFDSSWSRGQAATFVTNQVVKGFEWALEGQKVGSTLMSVIAPADGYGSSGQPSAGITGTDTMVFVITIESKQ